MSYIHVHMYVSTYTLIHKLTNVCTHSHSILTHMYVHIHSDIPTHRQKCTCTGIAVISSPSSGFCPVHKARSPYSLQVTSQVFICSLFLPVSQFSICKVVPIINRICPRSSPHPPCIPTQLFNSRRENIKARVLPPSTSGYGPLFPDSKTVIGAKEENYLWALKSPRMPLSSLEVSFMMFSEPLPSQPKGPAKERIDLEA